MTKQLEEQRNNFLLELRAALKRKLVVVMILYNSEKDEYLTMSNGNDTNFDDVLNSFCELPFLGSIKPQDAFKEWKEYVDVEDVDIYGFELEDGMVQISILYSHITPSEEIEIREACCDEKLTNRLFCDGYNGDMDWTDYISLACAMRWLREARRVYINIRASFMDHEYTLDHELHFVAEICDLNTGKWLDNNIRENTYEKCAEAAINYYYDKFAK